LSLLPMMGCLKNDLEYAGSRGPRRQADFDWRQPARRDFASEATATIVMQDVAPEFARWSMRCRSNCSPIILPSSWARMPTSRAISQKALRWNSATALAQVKRRGRFSINSIIIQQAAVPSPCNKASATTGRSWCAKSAWRGARLCLFVVVAERGEHFFWFGQIMYQTLKAMMRPRMPGNNGKVVDGAAR